MRITDGAQITQIYTITDGTQITQIYTITDGTQITRIYRITDGTQLARIYTITDGTQIARMSRITDGSQISRIDADHGRVADLANQRSRDEACRAPQPRAPSAERRTPNQISRIVAIKGQ
jgi:hypothetical protein